MAQTSYVGIGNTARRTKGFYIGVNDVARKVKKAYIGVGGVAKPFYDAGVNALANPAAGGTKEATSQTS